MISNGPPLRCSTVRQSSSGSVANASSGLGGNDDPRRLRELRLELAGAPAGVAGEEPEAPDRQFVRLGLRGHEADAAEDRRRRGVDVVELRQHHERLRLHRPADVDGVVRARQQLQRRHGLAGGDVGRPAEHEAHRAFLVVVRDQDDRLAEVRVVQRRRRDEQLALERLHLRKVPLRRRWQTPSGCVLRRPGGGPRPGRRRSGRRGPASACPRAASRRSARGRRAPGRRGRSRRTSTFAAKNLIAETSTRASSPPSILCAASSVISRQAWISA